MESTADSLSAEIDFGLESGIGRGLQCTYSCHNWLNSHQQSGGGDFRTAAFCAIWVGDAISCGLTACFTGFAPLKPRKIAKANASCRGFARGGHDINYPQLHWYQRVGVHPSYHIIRWPKQ